MQMYMGYLLNCWLMDKWMCWYLCWRKRLTQGLFTSDDICCCIVDGLMNEWIDVLLFVLKSRNNQILFKISRDISVQHLVQTNNHSGVWFIDSISCCMYYLLEGLHSLATNNLFPSYYVLLVRWITYYWWY